MSSSSSLSNIGNAAILGAAGIGTAVGVVEGKTMKERALYGVVGAIAGGVAGYAAVQLISMIPAAAGAGVSAAVQSFVQFLNSPQTAYALATSNPVSQAAAASTIKAGVVALNPIYSNAAVVWSNTPYNLQTMIATSETFGNVPIIDVSPQGVGTYAPSSTGKGGNTSNPFDYQRGWQGSGFYNNITGLYPALVLELSTLTQYNNPQLVLNSQ